MTDLTTYLGYLAGTLTTIAFFPQLLKIWRSKSAEDVSLAMFVIFTSGVALWLGYGILIDAWPIIVANTVTLLLAFAILVLKLRYSRSAQPPRRTDP
ncbi:MAG: SemiSWEET transporter [Nitrospiraceae bacterium]